MGFFGRIFHVGNRIIKRQRLRADAMLRHQGQGHEQLIFNQCLQIKIAAHHQQVFFAVVILGLRGGFVFDKTKIALHFQRHLDRLQATLAGQGCLGVHFQHQPRMACATGLRLPLALGMPSDAFGGRVAQNFFGKTRVGGLGGLPLQGVLALGKCGDVQVLNVECFGFFRHRAAV